MAVKKEEKNLGAGVADGFLKISIGEGKGIDLRVPVTGLQNGEAVTVDGNVQGYTAEDGGNHAGAGEKDKVVAELTRRHYKITEVKRGPETKIDGTVLYIRDGIEKEAYETEELVHELTIDFITPDKYDSYSDSIMDVQPVATKEGDSPLGQGVTRVLDGVVMMLTGRDEAGKQIGEFGSSEGTLDEHIMFGRPGSPDRGDILIRVHAVIQEGTGMERRGPMSVHRATDVITQEIRMALKKLEPEQAIETETFKHVRRYGRKKVVIVKEIMGQGAMHDNYLLPEEPVGVLGARPNVDIGNVPIMTEPLEVLDGCIHALTCIGPSTKETSRHYWREPLVLATMEDEELDLCGVIFVGSPQVNAEKFYVSGRVGAMVAALDVDGAFVGTEGEGNNHIDYSSHIEQIGKRGIPVVGLTFSAKTGALVVGNKYMDHMIELAKCEDGLDNRILENNTITPMDAERAIAMLKNAMAGEPVKSPERHWTPEVRMSNLEIVEDVTGKKINREPNETSLPVRDKEETK